MVSAMFAATLSLLVPCVTFAQADSGIVGNYACRSIGSRPCDTSVTLQLLSNGYWGWGKYSGQYAINGATVEFVSGSGGPVRWGPATIGPNTLTFTSGSQLVVWQKPGSAAAAAAGAYRCASLPGGGSCQTARPIVMDGQGSWKWGASGGAYTVVGAQVYFHGPSSGPPGWGPADIGNGTLTFHAPAGASVWTL
jgi:hypothetical protein